MRYSSALILMTILVMHISAAAAPGDLKWKMTFEETLAKGYPLASIAIGLNDDIYVNDGGNLYALTNEGVHEWTFHLEASDEVHELGFYFNEPPAIGLDSTIYLVISSGFWWQDQVIAVDAAGNFKWQSPKFSQADIGMSMGGITILDRTQIAFCANSWLYIYNTDGTAVDSFRIYSSIMMHPVVIGRNGLLHFHATSVPWGEGHFYCNAKNGTQIWEKYIGTAGYPSGDKGMYIIDRFNNIYCPYRCSYFLGNVPVLFSLSADGTTRWEITGEFTPPVMASNDVLYTTSADTLHGFNIDGQKELSLKISLPPTSNLLLGDKRAIYFAAGDSNIYAFSTMTQNQLWSYNCSSKATFVQMDSKGTLYAVDESGALHAIETESHGLDYGNWPTFQCDAQNSGNSLLTATLVRPDTTANIPHQFALSSNYPNPFNPSTTIRFELPKDGYVTMKIYDLSGRLVKTLLSRNQTAGAHTILWDGADDAGRKVAAGVFFTNWSSPARTAGRC